MTRISGRDPEPPQEKEVPQNVLDIAWIQRELPDLWDEGSILVLGALQLTRAAFGPEGVTPERVRSRFRKAYPEGIE